LDDDVILVSVFLRQERNPGVALSFVVLSLDLFVLDDEWCLLLLPLVDLRIFKKLLRRPRPLLDALDDGGRFAIDSSNATIAAVSAAAALLPLSLLLGSVGSFDMMMNDE